MTETKNERFRRLAKSRGDRLLREIRLLGNLSNRKNYEYSDSDVESLLSPIEQELETTRALFSANTTSERKIEFNE